MRSDKPSPARASPAARKATRPDPHHLDASSTTSPHFPSSKGSFDLTGDDEPMPSNFLGPRIFAPESALDTLPVRGSAHAELLRDAVFPDWKDDAAGADLESADDPRKKDPLGLQVWKYYVKTRSGLPNHERMENLSWRMMHMNLKKQEREQAELYVPSVLSLSCRPRGGPPGRAARRQRD